GDTLFGIALEYGVKAAAIQEQNGMDNPNALSIGQALIIPQDEPEEAETSPAVQGYLILRTPTPLPLPEAHIALYPTAVGGIWCLGEVANSTTGPITNLQVQVTLLDAPRGRWRPRITCRLRNGPLLRYSLPSLLPEPLRQRSSCVALNLSAG
ncbi:MAG: LysM peptidoglycan-binding domain-containing protein, partial [Anaerolineae bacterium]|nr:LysM peptidoglycan-binding domain-containing protein [Anaerolineae bacterium]